MRAAHSRLLRRKTRVVLAALAGTLVFVSGAAGDQVVAGGYTTCVLSGHSVSCWGYNNYGQLGDGTTTNRGTPAAISDLAADDLSVGWFHVCAVRTDASVACWGRNDYGQLGDGTTTNRLTPTTVSGITSATSVAASVTLHSCATISDGSVDCWGRNNYGQLGDGSTTDSSTPVSVSGITTATKVTAGDSFSCALLSGGTIKCWGWGSYGQLGNGSTASSTTPVSVSGITTAIDVQAEGYGACALLADETVKCWGDNSVSGLGNGDASVTRSSTPLSVAGITTAVSFGIGTYDGCALLASGAVKCWGSNGYGEDGNGDYSQHVTPVSVSGISSATSVTAGIYHSCAMTSAATLYCWGYNGFGQLGDGTTTTSPTPVEVVPVNVSLPAITGTPTEGQTLSASAGSWIGATSYTYEWLRCTNATGGCSEITGATSSTYTLTSDDVGYTLAVAVMASNPTGATTVGSTHTAPIWTSLSQAEMADEVMPSLLFDAQEPWRPLNVNSFLSETFSDGTHHQLCVWNSNTQSATCSGLTGPSTLTPVINFDPQNPVYIDVHGTSVGGSDYSAPDSVLAGTNCDGTNLKDCNGGGHSAIYYTTGADTAGYEYFNYWFFYRYNSTSWTSAFIDNHEGDWEGATVVLDARGTHSPAVAFAYYNEHNTGTWYPYFSLEFDGSTTHPLAYVARGDHATYGASCTYPTFCENPETGTQEADASGTKPWDWNADGSCTADGCLMPLGDSSLSSWTDWGGWWGIPADPNNGATANGPTSPAAQSSYKCTKNGFDTSQGCTRASGMRSLGQVGRTPAKKPKVAPLHDCGSWFGGSAVATICNLKLLTHAIASHQMRKRWALQVSVTGHRVGSAPGVAQALGGALVPGQEIKISGKAGVGTELEVMVFDRSHLEIATYTELGLEHGGTTTLTIKHGRQGPVLMLKTPRGRVRPARVELKSVTLKPSK